MMALTNLSNVDKDDIKKEIENGDIERVSSYEILGHNDRCKIGKLTGWTLKQS
jgi:hypothetical protein